MIPSFIVHYLILIFGTLYPSYSSYKAIKNKNVKEYARWMMYWVCFGIFSFAEVVTDILFGFWLPFYYEIKILFILWLMSPYGNGARIMYRSIIHPELNRREEVIDSYILKLKRLGINSFKQFCGKFGEIFSNVVSQAINLGHKALMDHLHNGLNANQHMLGPQNILPSIISAASASSEVQSDANLCTENDLIETTDTIKSIDEESLKIQEICDFEVMEVDLDHESKHITTVQPPEKRKRAKVTESGDQLRTRPGRAAATKARQKIKNESNY